MKDDLSRYVDLSAKEDIIITKHGVPTAVLIGLTNPEDLWEELLLRAPRFKERIAKARADARAGRVKTLDEVRAEFDIPKKPAKSTVAKQPNKRPVRKPARVGRARLTPS
jgi:prevent-host-death family protein